MLIVWLMQTPLCLAVITNQPVLVDRLLQLGSDINAQIIRDRAGHQQTTTCGVARNVNWGACRSFLFFLFFSLLPFFSFFLYLFLSIFSFPFSPIFFPSEVGPLKFRLVVLGSAVSYPRGVWAKP